MTPPFDITPIMFARDLRDAGVQARDVVAAIDAGKLFHVARGVYASSDVYLDPDLELAVACYRTGGTVGLLTAAIRHSLCDAAPSKIEMFVPHGLTRRSDDLPISMVRTRGHDVLRLGVDRSDFHGLELRVTDPARTICDLYRIQPDVHRQHAVASLATFMSRGGDEQTLYRYAKAFRVWDVIGPEVEAIAETYSRGMRP